jgi:regulator of protease activity HflC (stomatin/prohibitin superfamily)
MIWFILGLLFVIGAVGLFVKGSKASKTETLLRSKSEEYNTRETNGIYNRLANGEALKKEIGDAQGLKWATRGVAVILLGLGVWFISIATLYTNTVGEAKVIVNTATGTLDGEKLDSGLGLKAPWQDVVDFDLFSQEVLYAGGDQAPSYSGGTITGKEVTVAVGGVNGGSTQANMDVSITYSLDAEHVTEIYSEYKSQERFTKQAIEKTILSTVRQVPANYNAIEFRGTERQTAADKIADLLNERLKAQGVEVNFVNIQDIRYPESVENALREVEVQNQAAQSAEAKQRAAQVEAETKLIEAQGVANAAIEAARGEAEANRLLNESLTPGVLQQRQIDAYKEGTVFVVPEGSTPFVQIQK